MGGRQGNYNPTKSLAPPALTRVVVVVAFPPSIIRWGGDPAPPPGAGSPILLQMGGRLGNLEKLIIQCMVKFQQMLFQSGYAANNPMYGRTGANHPMYGKVPANAFL